MTRSKNGIVLAAALAAVCMPTAVRAEPQTIGSDARIVEQIQFALLLEMNFGKIVPNPGGGTVVLNASNGERDCSGAMACTGSFSISELRVSGSDANVLVNYDTSIELTGPGDPMVVNIQLPGGTGQTFSLTGGEIVLSFGATLNTNASQAAGSYSGPFSVNVSYQ